MDPCVKCGAPGHIHHIVYRSHGGLNNSLNLINLCPYHHELGPEAPHQSRQADLEFKRELQEQYFDLFDEDEYTVEQIAELIGISLRKTQEAFLKVNNFAGTYQKEDVIRRLMGGRLY